ncbi:Cyanobacterial phytochrome B [Rhodovastum atsumiense]|uniref:histidine kinase n=1 Tax=Rhodovastum atsumiense TaxID=504468 RepID=A0A5M6INW8_9PROT|nr:ATP-binding protein [Rhodovastum atsumiense]KAA5609950.1 GAF domain-containing protein [Rhodovastum atsumiense]CAH2604571.1 Cyanobacterial phytochrome B [Rhodovastum atsumiense]
MQHEAGAADAVVTAANVDLSNCDRELVHMPGLIQPHGVMLVLRPSDLGLLQASANMADLFGIPVPDLLSRGLPALLGDELAAALGAAIRQAGERLDRGPAHLLEVPAAPGRDAFDAMAHRAGDVLILELERRGAADLPMLNPYADLADCTGQLQSAASLQGFLEAAVTQVRAFTGFDRVMAYSFTADGSGAVVAEAIRDGLNPYLGQHFPASDIPAPARRLFALSWLRHLPNVDYTPVPLLPPSDQPVDMSRAILRHVSVMYSSYLKNMRAHATMVMPLMKDSALWGLISCMHHAAPLHVPCRTRTAVELLAHMVSSLMAEQEERDTAAYRGRMGDAIIVLHRQMEDESDHRRGLCRGDVTLLGWLDATGAALVTEGGVMLLGTTPSETEVRGIAAWLDEQDDTGPVFATDGLAEAYPPARSFQQAASGLLAARLMRSRQEFVMWFRPELVQTVSWAGDPRKPVQIDVVDGEARLTPRTSFDLWKEDVRGRSRPWLACEVEAAGSLRQAIAEVVLLRLNEELRKSNTELDSFAYVASHDLKEPLRGIHNFAHFLDESAHEKLNEEERGRIETILRLTRRMDDLTDALLQYSRVGRTEVVLQPVDLDALLRAVLEQLAPRIAEGGVEIRVPRPLPKALGDPVRLTEVLTNLIVNALKFTERPAGERWIEIGWREENGQRLFCIRDNGIGIAPQHLETVFQIFRRLHGRDKFGGGTGAGLTIARRMVERLGGRLWAESDGPGQGTSFLFTLAGTPEGENRP